MKVIAQSTNDMTVKFWKEILERGGFHFGEIEEPQGVYDGRPPATLYYSHAVRVPESELQDARDYKRGVAIVLRLHGHGLASFVHGVELGAAIAEHNEIELMRKAVLAGVMRVKKAGA